MVNSKLADFNTEAARRNVKWKPAKTADDLALMKEYEFLQVLQAISVIGKSVKTELEHCLDSRNACGHPNSFKIAGSKVAAHVEVLLLNVYEQFQLPAHTIGHWQQAFHLWTQVEICNKPGHSVTGSCVRHS